jgi:hypothetical protein
MGAEMDPMAGCADPEGWRGEEMPVLRVFTRFFVKRYGRSFAALFTARKGVFKPK